MLTDQLAFGREYEHSSIRSFLEQRSCSAGNGHPDVGRSHGCVTNVSWGDFTSSADGVALAWFLFDFAGAVS